MDRPTSRSNAVQLVFTRDFHELTRGHLERGCPCTLSYDPARIVPPGDDYVFGDPSRPITAFVRFRADGPVTPIPLVSWAGTLEHAPTTVTGQGPMLKGEFRVPEDAEWIQVWFTFVDRSGQTQYDSEFGRNYTFRFLHEELQVERATVEGEPDRPLALFRCRVLAAAGIQELTVRYRIVNGPSPAEELWAALQWTGQTDPEGCVYWELPPTPVPCGAVLAFDLHYLLDGNRLKNDAQGRYFIAGDPERMRSVGLLPAA